MVDFESNAGTFRALGITVVAASVDTTAETADLAAGLRLRFVKMLVNLDPAALAEAVGAYLHIGDRTYPHATGFVLNPAGEVVNAVYSTGPIGRFTASEVLRKVAFEQAQAAR